MKYTIHTTLPHTNLEMVRPRVEAALKEEGFGVLTEIDIQATMKKKLDKDYRPHVILGACNPGYADKVLSIDPHISAFLPCNVTLRALEDGAVEVSAIDPIAAMGALGHPDIAPLAREVEAKLRRVVEGLNQSLSI